MSRRRLVPTNQIIALLIFMAASVSPLYSQEIKTSQDSQATAASLQNEDPNTESSVKVESSLQVATAQTKTNQTTTPQFVFPTRRERFNRYVKSVVGPASFAGSAIVAGIDQWRDRPVEWEQGASGYGRRYASDFGRNAIQQTVVYGLDSALGLDTRFRKSTRKGFFPRMTDALAENVTSRTRTGKRVISVPRITGVYAARVIQAEAWYPERYSYKDGLRRGTRSLVTGFGLNLVREFVISF
jgi:hypothetical protein